MSRKNWVSINKNRIATMIGVASYLASLSAIAAPCYPNDPDGTNPGNLCLNYPPSWSPIPNTSTDQPPFILGTGKEAYYGLPVSTTQPGRIIGTTNGYWTNVEAVNGFTSITDNTGKTINVP